MKQKNDVCRNCGKVLTERDKIESKLTSLKVMDKLDTLIRGRDGK